MTNTRRAASVSLDLDNHWAYLRTHGDEAWRDFPSYLSVAAPRIGEFFSEIGVKPTIFVVGKDLELDDGRETVSSFAQLGYEIANHSDNHRADFHSLDEHEITTEITSCAQKIASLIGKKPVGFRGPSFQISEKIAKILITEGYRYDASSYPTSIGPLARAYHLFHAKLTPAEKHEQRHLFGGFRSAFAPLELHRWDVGGNSIVEIPVTTMPLARLPIHFTYLNFLADKSETLAFAYLNFALILLRATGVKPSLLLHATDFLGCDDSPIPKFLPGMKRPHKDKIKFLSRIFSRFEKYYEFSGLGTLI